MQLRPTYPTNNQAQNARKATKQRQDAYVQERNLTYQESEPRFMHLSFDDYKLFLRGYTFHAIRCKQWEEDEIEYERHYMRLQEKWEEWCRWNDFLQESAGRN